jgi:hypothetical protein
MLTLDTGALHRENLRIETAPSLHRYNSTGFFLLGYLKDQVFRTKVSSLVEPRAIINSAFASDTQDAGKHMW